MRIHLGLLILRLALGILLLLHGLNKVMSGIGGIIDKAAAVGLPEFIAYGVYFGEVAAPVLIILGLRTRLAAIVFAVNMAAAAYLVHPDEILAFADTGAWELELIGLYFFGAVALIFTGGGKFALSSSSKWD